MTQNSNRSNKRLAMISVSFVVALGLLLGLGQPVSAAVTTEGREQGVAAAVAVQQTGRLVASETAGVVHQVVSVPRATASTMQAVYGLPKIPWGEIKDLVKKWGKWVWYKAHLCVAEVVKQWANIVFSPAPVYKAALVCAWAMR